MKDEKQIDVYEIQDLYLSAYLMAIGKEMVAVKRNNEKQNVLFIFKPFQDENEVVVQYYNGQGNVGAMKFVNAISALKSLVHKILKGDKQNGKD